MSGFILSDDKAQLDVARVHRWLASSYWSPGIARELVERGIAGAHCIGAYRGAEQIGFARLITDYATFGWVADVWVDAGARKQGVGRAMVQWFLDHPDCANMRRFALTTGDAHGVYAALGFHAPLRPERYMERLSPEAAAQLRALP